MRFDDGAEKLFPVSASLRAIGEKVVRPLLLADFQRRVPVSRSVSGRHCWRALRCGFPIRGWIRDSPDISMGIKGGSDQEEFVVVSKRHAVRYPRGYAASSWQTAHHDRSFQLQRARAAEAASLSADDEHDASL